MLNISDEFFKEETRLGFTISETMKKAWAVQLEMLESVFSIAQKHNISIWADSGTLLGAVRHNGFIPWDDDSDLCMLRKDYMVFSDILKTELPSLYSVSSFYVTEDYDQPKICITNRHQLDIGNSLQETEITKKLHNFPYIAGIDIFPLDYVPSDPDQLSIIQNLYFSAYDLAFDYDYYKSNNELESYLSQLENILNTKLKRDDHLRTSIWKLADAIAMMTYENESTEVAYYAECAAGGFQKKRSIHDYEHTEYLDFEMIKIPVPCGYEDALISTYGNDYMTPIRAKGWHDYPFYKVQDKKILFSNRLGQIGDIF